MRLISAHSARLVPVALCLAVFAGAGRGGESGDAGSTGAFAPSTIELNFAHGLLRRNLHEEAAAQYTKFLTAFPNDPRLPEAILRRGEAYFILGKYTEAARDYYTYLTQYPQAPEQETARLRYGSSLYQLGHHAQAIQALSPLVERKMGSAQLQQTAAYYLGRSYQAIHQPEKAVEALARVREGELAPLAAFARGELLASGKKHAEAAAAFGAFGERFPQHALALSALLRRGEELRAAGRLDDAAAAFGDVIARSGDNPALARQGRYGLAWVRHAQGKFDEAARLAVAVAGEGDPALAHEAYYLAGLSAFRKGAYAESETLFAKVGPGPRQEAALRQRTWALLLDNRPGPALDVIAEHEKLFPAAARPEMHYLAGKAHALRADWDDATRHLQAARDAGETYAEEAAYELGLALDAAGRYGEAAEAFGYYAKTFPRGERLIDARIGQGKALIKADKYEAALPVYMRLLEMPQADETVREHALSQQAVCYYRLKQYSNMQASYRRLLEAFPNGSFVPDALYWLGWYEYAEKRFTKAASLYRQLLQRFPDHALAPRARYRMAMSLYQGGDEAGAADVLLAIVETKDTGLIDQKEMLWLGSFLMNAGRLEAADTVYEALLARNPPPEVRAVAIYYQAEARLRREDWKGALARYEELLGMEAPAMRNLARYGAAVCYRRLGDLATARALLDKVELAPDDPLVAYVLFERGQLDFAEKKYTSAAQHLMRVGMLYDDEKLCGEALLKAGDASRAAGDVRKARICYEELAGDGPDTYGARHPESEFAATGRERLGQLDAPADGEGR